MIQRHRLNVPSLMVVFITLSVAAAFAQSNRTTLLRNQDIIGLKKAGVSDDVILLKIENSSTAFRTDASDLILLKKNGLSDVVIVAMVKAGRTDLITAPTPDASSAHTIRDSSYSRVDIFTGVSILARDGPLDEKPLPVPEPLVFDRPALGRILRVAQGRLNVGVAQVVLYVFNRLAAIQEMRRTAMFERMRMTEVRRQTSQLPVAAHQGMHAPA